MRKHPPSVQRFPRLLRGKQAAAFVTLLWQKPQFSVRIPKNRRAVVFRFEVPVTSKVRRSYPHLVGLLFDPGSPLDDWKVFLAQSYRSGKSGKRTYDQYISKFLQRVYINAVGLYLNQIWSGHQNLLRAKGIHLENFAKTSRIKRSQPNPSVALHIATKYEDYKTKVKDISVTIGKEKNGSNRVFFELIRDRLPGVDLPRLLSKFADGPEDERWRIFAARHSGDEIAKELVKSEIGAGYFAPTKGKHSLNTYIRLGRQIRKALDEPPLQDGPPTA